MASTLHVDVVAQHDSSILVVPSVIALLAVLFATYRYYQSLYAPLRIVELRYYPLKSCQGLTTKRAEVNRLGLKYDRQWMLVDSDVKSFHTQRTFPAMAIIKSRMEGDKLIAQCDGHPDLEIPMKPTADAKDHTVVMYGTPVKCTVYTEPHLGAWFTKVLNKPTKLAIILKGEVETHQRELAQDWIAHNMEGVREGNTSTGLSDGFPITVNSLASMRDLNKRLQARGQPALHHDRFRGNAIIDGGSRVLKAWEEDDWASLQIGNMTLYAPKLLDRCTVPLIEQTTGKRNESGEPVQLLREFRDFASIWHKTGRSPYVFGLNCIQRPENGVLRVGDRVTVQRRSKPMWFPKKPDDDQ